jgi:hypothetical protein
VVDARAGDRCPRCQSPSYRSRPAPFAKPLVEPVAAAPQRRLRPLRAAGWYPDPTERFELRWFDGDRWSELVTVDGEKAIDLNPTGLSELWEHPAARDDASTVA